MKVVADHDYEIERLRAELAYQRELCQRILRAHDEQAVALFLLRKGLKKIAIGDGNDPQLVARRYLDQTWLRLHDDERGSPRSRSQRRLAPPH